MDILPYISWTPLQESQKEEADFGMFSCESLVEDSSWVGHTVCNMTREKERADLFVY